MTAPSPPHDRLAQRRLRLQAMAYLHYRYLWASIARAVEEARGRCTASVPTVVDVGCGNRPYVDLFPGCHYLGLDRDNLYARPDVVSDGSSLPLRDAVADIVLSTQVIEHVPDPSGVVRECCRVLRPGGTLILTAPFYWPLHEEPHDYFRYTRYALERMACEAGFREWRIWGDGGGWAHIFLAINLRLPRRHHAPIRLVLNLLGLLLNRQDEGEKAPINYTMVAIR